MEHIDSFLFELCDRLNSGEEVLLYKEIEAKGDKTILWIADNLGEEKALDVKNNLILRERWGGINGIYYDVLQTNEEGMEEIISDYKKCKIY